MALHFLGRRPTGEEEAQHLEVTHFRLELAVVAGIGVADGIWTPIERLADHALPTLMKKVARHAISAPAANPYTGSAASAANSGRSLSTASRTGMKERR